MSLTPWRLLELKLADPEDLKIAIRIIEEGYKLTFVGPPPHHTRLRYGYYLHTRLSGPVWITLGNVVLDYAAILSKIRGLRTSQLTMLFKLLKVPSLC